MIELNKGNRLLWMVTGLLLAVVCAVAVYKAWPVLFPEISRSAAVDPDCDLRAGSCVTRLNDGGRVSFSIEPREIPTLKPLRLQVALHGVEADKVEIDFAGVAMNMGFNRVKMERAAEGGFTGNGILPVCVRDAMEWEARVLVSTRQGLLSVPYRFITVRPGAPLPGAE
ncbi:MAG: hypothetical protein KZQ76_15360 [Candidatus Thiodiazotropha sp. (ex Epidulcina cf. delphinae)]|nr:hypothetical protein [Candidatus Thiodiazotropha sp. (ex Epidulcina cf. delphinae)]